MLLFNGCEESMPAVRTGNLPNSCGFTLVEAAIVMVIVGLLTGGVLKGAALLENARVNATIAKVQDIHAAVVTFKDIYYQQLPGDFIMASTRLMGCNASSHCLDGDGNGFIASDGSDQYNWLSNVVRTDRSTNRQESTQFWKHLALADVLALVESGADPRAPEWGKTHPVSPISGGFEAYFDGWMAVGGGNSRSSHIFRLSNALGRGVEPAVSPRIASRIDRKMDDGNPQAGDVFANYGRARDDCKSGNRFDGVYNERYSGNVCILYFVAQF